MADVGYLSQAWVDLLAENLGGLPERPGASARVQYVVTGTPDGEVRYHVSVRDGRLESAGLGDHPDADVTLTTTYADAREISSGALDASVAFMQGRVKVVGDMGHVMALMPVLQSDEYRQALAGVAGRTAV